MVPPLHGGLPMSGSPYKYVAQNSGAGHASQIVVAGAGAQCQALAPTARRCG